MRTRRETAIQNLRRTVECLPRETRVAMLEGIRGNDIIVGAYSTRDGICPMLAAHRAGGRTSFIAFAKAWDRFGFAGVRRAGARRATERELRVLTAHLEASLLEDERPSDDLGAAIAEHRELIARRGPRAKNARSADATANDARPGDPDRTPEFRHRPGWAWLRVVRRYDDYERALARLESQTHQPQGAEAGPRELQPSP